MEGWRNGRGKDRWRKREGLREKKMEGEEEENGRRERKK